MGKQDQRIVSFFSYKGGVGKTTLGLALASALAEAGKDVVVYDIDDTARTSLEVAQDNQLPFPVVKKGTPANGKQFLIVDHPPHSDANTGADLVVVPVVPERGAVAGMKSTIEAIGAHTKIVVAINELSSSNAERDAIAAGIEQFCAARSLPFVRIRRRSAHEFAKNRGGTVFQKACVQGTHSKGVREAREDIKALADVVIARLS